MSAAPLRIGGSKSPIGMATRFFFDRQRVIAAVGKVNAKVLREQGRILQRAAKSSIKKRKGPSKPGSAPHSHKGQLRRFLYYKFDPATKSVVVGPEKLGGSYYSAPETLEKSGRLPRRKNRRRRKLKIGSTGIIQISGRRRSSKTGRFQKMYSGKGAKPVTDWKGKRRRVVFVKLTSGKMVRRANELEEEIYGPATLSGSPIKARPYMGPALNTSKHSIAAVWRDQIR